MVLVLAGAAAGLAQPPAVASPASLCHDDADACAAWSRGGECVGENARWMRAHCPASCGSCASADVRAWLGGGLPPGWRAAWSATGGEVSS